MMKRKYLAHGLRILFAVAGVTYICYSLTWTDHVVVPAGDHYLSNGEQLHIAEPTAYPVIAGDLAEPAGNLSLKVSNTATLTITASDLGAKVNDFGAQPGVATTLSEAKVGLLLLGLLIVGPIYIIQAYRWWLLMRSRGLDVTVFKSFKLNLVGSFFNYCMPGTTGGDLIKAYYAAKNSDRRTDSVMSVIFDRIAGLLGLIFLGGTAGLVMILSIKAGWLELRPDQATVLYRVTGFIWLGVLVGAMGAAVYYSKRLRRMLGITWQRVSKLPGHKLMAKIDDAALAHRNHKGPVLAAVAMSLPVHLALAGATATAGYALGMDTPIGLLLTVIPVLFLAASVPLTYQGLGVMEGLAIALILSPTGAATKNQIVGMLLMARFYQIFYAMFGSLFLLKGDIHMHPQQRPTESEPAAAPVTTAPADSTAPPAQVEHKSPQEPVTVAS